MTTRKVGLNLGCGTRTFKSNYEVGWFNLDVNHSEGVNIVADWRDLHEMRVLPGRVFYGLSFDLIVAHQTFEHQGCGEQPIMACYDALKPEGRLIVSVPDLRKLAQMWLSGELSTQIYMTNIYGPYDGTEESRHRWGFDEWSLTHQLHESAPWASVKPFDWRPIPGADIARDDRWILCMEAVK